MTKAAFLVSKNAVIKHILPPERLKQVVPVRATELPLKASLYDRSASHYTMKFDKMSTTVISPISMVLLSMFMFSCGDEIKLENIIQEEFETTRKTFSSQYYDAPNQIKQSEIFNESRRYSCLFEQKHGNAFNDWEGEIDAIYTDQGGSEISNFSVSSKKHDFYYKQSGIKRGTALYSQIAEFKEGEKVKFDFKFNEEVFSSNVKECFDELSITESGSLSEPEFSVSFLKIKKTQ